MMHPQCLVLLLVLPLGPLGSLDNAAAADPSAPHVSFRKLVLSEAFHGEGAASGDINGDGHVDVVSGPYWYPGPEYRARYAYTEPSQPRVAGYSNHFFCWTDDFNHDGHADILVIGFPGGEALWYENPGEAGREQPDRYWARHVAWSVVDGEAPLYTDLTGDGRRELVCMSGGVIGFASPSREQPHEVWSFTAVTPDRGYGRFTHGLGVGDVNNDGRDDILETHGWWEQTDKPEQPFKLHEFRFAEAGGAQMFAYDFDGDGDNDVVSVQNAHAWGLNWFEQRGNRDNRVFIPHPILTEDPDHNPGGLAVSQMHSLALIDIDGDGVKDLVTGKRYWAHNGHDPGSAELPVLCWLRTVRTPPRVAFEPHLIDTRSGVGTQLTVGDVSGDGRPDLLVGNKLGTYLFLQGDPSRETPQLDSAEARRLLQAGTAAFQTHIRETPPLTPAQEQATFVLPEGFDVQLVASEPDIAKPINMAFDARGRLWVSNTVEYPFPAPEDRPGRDTIKVLEDEDGDGRADRITTFADGLNVPIGLYPYLDGVICYSIPFIWFLRDTDGDGVADQREKLFGPFDYSRDTHGLCNGFARGLDGWLYACHGFNNHSAVQGTDGHQIEMQSGNTFRMRLDGSRLEHVTHGQVNPFGIAIDKWGDFFTTDCHTRPIMMLLPGGYYESFGKPHDGLGFVPNVMEHMHGSTGFAGIALGEATQFPTQYDASVFVGNVITGRINRDTIRHVGSTVQAIEETDLLIPGDPWFRPVDLQVGPDGSMYVADFYNRIIGHYEVPLDHPGRDRHRGRIWRIRYVGSDARRDVLKRPGRAAPTRLAADPTEAQRFATIATGHPAAARLAADQLADQGGPSTAATARSHLFTADATQLRVHALWILHRLGALRIQDLVRAAEDPDEALRVHAFRAIAEHRESGEAFGDLLRQGFQDPAPLVRRAAVMAAARHPQPKLVRPLLERFQTTPGDDVHLQHAIRLALQSHFRDPATLAAVVEQLDAAPSQPHVALIASVCASLHNQVAADFIADHLAELATGDKSKFADYLAHAAACGSAATAARLATAAESAFAEDHDFQLQLLESVRVGLADRGLDVPDPIRDWATRIAGALLEAAGSTATPLSWTFVPHPESPQRKNAWSESRARKSADGVESIPLYSSYPEGEQGTGIYRSAPFKAADRFRFFLAGHDGHPDRRPDSRNEVRLCDASTHQVLRRCGPPRNDVAQMVEWETDQFAGRAVYLELVDGNAENAFAWLAAGRFSEPRLDPSPLRLRRLQAVRLVGLFHLPDFHARLCDLLREPGLDPESMTTIAAAIVTLDPDARLMAVTQLPAIAAAPPELVGHAIEAVVTRDPAAAAALLCKAMLLASSAEQNRLAEALVGDLPGSETLISIVEAGAASPRTLLDPSIDARLRAVATPSQLDRIAELVQGLPEEEDRVAELIASRKSRYLLDRGKANVGHKLFLKHCAACHQVAGEGAQVGPNLDGIGNRGLDRIVEDTLAPNRNVDVAFRAATIVTTEGRVLSGLAKTNAAGDAILFDAEGKKSVIPAANIEQLRPSKRSPMPANLGDTLTESEFGDLLAYLLSLRAS